MQVYDNSIVGSLARSVDIVADLEANSRFQNICVWKFLDSHFTSGDDLYDKKILILFLDYIRLLVQPAHYD